MTSSDQKLAHALRMQFGTSAYEPTDPQLVSIKSAIHEIQRVGKLPSKEDWRAEVHKCCPTAGTYKYAGLDNSDLNTLLALATQSAKG